MKRSQQQGYTMMELLITVLVLAVLIAIAAPAYQQMLERQRVRDAVNEWQNSFYLAQREAMRLKDNVYLCGSKDGQTCDLSGREMDFSNGWIVAVKEPTGPNNFRVLQDVPFREKGIKLVLRSGNKPLIFDSNGRVNLQSSLAICLESRMTRADCDASQSYDGKVFSIQNSRLMMKKP